jgi:NAD(P)-dependent dehydrogenase (short-subunit alcohol dehydrogenase family)
MEGSMNILITGASSGFGKAAAQTLAKGGHTVVATMRGTDGKNKASADELAGTDNIHVVDIDVTSDDSVNKGIAQAIEKAGGLDVVVNNAGIAGMGVSESFTVDDVKSIFDVNTFGPVRVANAVLPHFREKKAGLIVNIATIVAQFPFPYMGAYCASKAALEVLSDDYAATASSVGVETVVLEPGAYPTEIYGKMVAPSKGDLTASYPGAGETMEGMGKGFATLFENLKPNPQDVVDGLVKLIETPAGKRPARTVVDGLSGKVVEAHHEARAAKGGEFMALYAG